jgi:hypothetical protein
MNPTARAEADQDIADFQRKFNAVWSQNVEDVSQENREQVYAHIAFAALDHAITSHVEHMRSKKLDVNYGRLGSAITVTFALRSVTYSLPLEDKSVSMIYRETEPSSGKHTIARAVYWPSDLVPLSHIHAPVESFVRDMRRYLLHGTMPA